MVLRAVGIVKKKPSSHKVGTTKATIRLKKVTSAPEPDPTESRMRSSTVVLKRPSCLTRPAHTISDWREFTPKTIIKQRCLARTWDDGYGGQCTRSQSSDNSQLCSAHQLESERPQGLTHGLVSGDIPARKLAEFKSVRIFREVARRERSHQPDADEGQGDVLAAEHDIAATNVQIYRGDRQPRSVQCARIRVIEPRRRPGTCIKGGKDFPREHFEQLAMAATKDAPDYLLQRVGYPLPIVGSLHCKLLGFERDLDGIRPTTICIYEWRFSHGGIPAVEARYCSKHKCRNLLYNKQSIRPPWQVRTAACVVNTLINGRCNNK